LACDHRRGPHPPAHRRARGQPEEPSLTLHPADARLRVIERLVSAKAPERSGQSYRATAPRLIGRSRTPLRRHPDRIPRPDLNVKAIATDARPAPRHSWHRSDAVTRGRAIAFTRQGSGRPRVRARSACSVMASTASSRDYVWSPKQSQPNCRVQRRKRSSCTPVAGHSAALIHR
jgi:hypothetical protein